MEEMPTQQEKMREALQVIAEVRDNERLRQFLQLGRDRKDSRVQGMLLLIYWFIAGDIVAPVRSDLPRGINQLGNTCYLNSL